jgi:DNA-directed RNA polymerase specialized sigma24 family protein
MGPRDKVREYSTMGYSQREIAAELQIPKGDVNRDLKFLRQEAKQNSQPS